MSSPLLDRRRFLATSLMAGSVLVLPRLGGAASTRANSRLQLALVGVGGRGRIALHDLQEEQIVAFCDVDFARGRETVAADERAGPALARFSSARWFNDYRVMFEQMSEQIDAVVVSVPDHMHYAIAMTAIAYGKHVYVEKPLCRCVSEVRSLQAAARRAGVVTQMGNQGRAGEGIRRAREWVQGGLLGAVHEVHLWTDRPMPPWFLDPAFDPDAEPRHEVPPATLHYDLWLGSSPARPYRPALSHVTWRGFSDYGCGSLGDMGCHQLDAAYFALDLGHPERIEAATTKLHRGTFPATTAVTWDFPARGVMPPVQLKWFDGGLLPPAPVPGFRFGPDGGSIFYGERAIMWVGSHSRNVRLLPEDRMGTLRDYLPPRTIPLVEGGPHQEWVRAIREGGQCGSNFDYAGPLSEGVLLGVAAIRAQTTLLWDGPSGRVTNHEEANRFIGPGYEYRRGWIPGV